MMRNVNEVRRMMWRKVIAVTALGVVGWLAAGAKAEINVTGPGDRGRLVVPKKGIPPFLRNRPRPFHSEGTFQTLDAEPGAGGSSPGNIIHPDPADPSTKVFLSVDPEELTIEAGQSGTVTVTATFVGTPPVESVRVFRGGIPRDLGITSGGLPSLSPTRRTHTFTLHTTTTVPPGDYQFYFYGLTAENKYTLPAEYILTVEAPPTPPPPTTTNSGTVEIVETNESIIVQGTYLLDGAVNEVFALYDNENNHIVDIEQGGNTSTPYPRFTDFTGLGTWTIEQGRGYAGSDVEDLGFLTANVVLVGVIAENYFAAAHLHVNHTTGVVSPILLTAGDLTNPAGVVMSTSAFEVAIEGTTPTSTANGFLRGVVEGSPNFQEPDGQRNWMNGVTFTFDVPLYND